MNFQAFISKWMHQTFRYAEKDYVYEATSSSTRMLRFMEEAIELFQAEGISKEKFVEVAKYVWDRPVGIIQQEIGGVMVTLAAYCVSKNIDLETEAWREFYRIDTPEMQEKIRNKQKEKPNNLPAPEPCRECGLINCECLPF